MEFRAHLNLIRILHLLTPNLAESKGTFPGSESQDSGTLWEVFLLAEHAQHGSCSRLPCHRGYLESGAVDGSSLSPILSDRQTQSVCGRGSSLQPGLVLQGLSP